MDNLLVVLLMISIIVIGLGTPPHEPNTQPKVIVLSEAQHSDTGGTGVLFFIVLLALILGGALLWQ